jgi:hypothetical protein
VKIKLSSWLIVASIIAAIGFIVEDKITEVVYFDARGEPLGIELCPVCNAPMGSGSNGPECFHCLFKPPSSQSPH